MGLYQVLGILRALLDFYEWLIVIWCLLSWLPLREGGIMRDFAEVLDRIVGPFIRLFRRFIPPLGGIDFSPVVAMLALSLVGNYLL